VINVLLWLGEEKLACWFTAFYEIELEQSDIKSAIWEEKYEWLNYVWAFKRNNVELEDGKGPVFVKMDVLFAWIGEKASKKALEGLEEERDEPYNVMTERARER
jgi:hypothetical protein